MAFSHGEEHQGSAGRIICSTDQVGTVTEKAAKRLDLGFFGSANEAVDAIATNTTYVPDMRAKKLYDGTYAVCKALYKSNRKPFSQLNRKG